MSKSSKFDKDRINMLDDIKIVENKIMSSFIKSEIINQFTL